VLFDYCWLWKSQETLEANFEHMAFSFSCKAK